MEVYLSPQFYRMKIGPIEAEKMACKVDNCTPKMIQMRSFAFTGVTDSQSVDDTLSSSTYWEMLE